MQTQLLSKTSPLLRIDLLQNNGDEMNLKDLCPLSNIKIDDSESKKLILTKIRKILFAMNIFDELFTEITGFKRHIYVLGDGTIFNFLVQNIVYQDINNIDKSYYLEIICTLGLAYRFNVAKKFGYSDTNVMQLRLNGWGRAYCLNAENINDYLQLKENIYQYWLQIISKYKSEYNNLVTSCDSTKRPLNIKLIHEINKIVPLKLVT
ncbi:hypothetical protein IT413_06305 [Candidatus Peregrinibacteria bacterium]|nr:hypothetical protein [Candidatus Peregrinibacteria bacterium]